MTKAAGLTGSSGEAARHSVRNRMMVLVTVTTFMEEGQTSFRIFDTSRPTGNRFRLPAWTQFAPLLVARLSDGTQLQLSQDLRWTQANSF